MNQEFYASLVPRVHITTSTKRIQAVHVRTRGPAWLGPAQRIARSPAPSILQCTPYSAWMRIDQEVSADCCTVLAAQSLLHSLDAGEPARCIALGWF